MAVAEPYLPPIGRRGWLRGTKAATRRVVARSARTDLAAAGLLVAVTVLALAGPLLAPYSPVLPTNGLPMTPPFHGSYLLGTDAIGRDVFSRVLYGIRISWFSALAVIASGVLIGGLVGLIAGAAGGWLDTALMRITDAFLALPGPIIAIAVVAALGPSLRNTLIAVMVVWWPFYARIVRGEIRSLVARPHLDAAVLGGASRTRRALRHLLPGAVPAIVVTASLDVSNLLITLAGLSFLGLGSPEPAPELGAMAAQNLQYLLTNWWVPVVPALAIFLLALVGNVAGDGVRNLLGRS